MWGGRCQHQDISPSMASRAVASRCDALLCITRSDLACMQGTFYKQARIDTRTSFIQSREHFLFTRTRNARRAIKSWTDVPAATRLRLTSSYVPMGISLGFGTKDFLGSLQKPEMASSAAR